MVEQMKPSGIDWIGDIPRNWNTKKVKYVISDIKDGTHGTFDRVESGELLLSAKNVFDDGIRIGDNESEISISDYKSIVSNGFPKRNDVLLCCVGTIGRCCVYEYDKSIAFQRSVAFLRSLQQTNARYLKYSLQSDSTLVQEQLLINKSAQDGLYMGSVRELIIPYPNSKSEQQSIADFLDRECAQIDSIATDLEKQIELLQQYKKSLITETVTKGLDKSVPMKDSGVEWIGQIPEHWDVEPIKYRVTFHNGDRGENYPTKSELQSEGIPFINAGHLEGDGLNMANMDYISEEKYRIMGGVKLRSGDILYCLRGSVGKNAIVDMNQGTVASSLVAIRSVRISAEYLYYCLNSHIEEVQRYWWDNGTAQPNLSADNLGKYKICIPPVEEQKAIVKYLNNICSQIDNLIIGKKKQLSTIQQHKKSLIYEYVTGKKRVKEVR